MRSRLSLDFSDSPRSQISLSLIRFDWDWDLVLGLSTSTNINRQATSQSQTPKSFIQAQSSPKSQKVKFIFGLWPSLKLHGQLTSENMKIQESRHRYRDVQFFLC